MKVKEALPEWVTREDSGNPMLSLEESRLRLAYTDYDKHRVAADVRDRLSKPPFTNQLDHSERLLGQEEEVADLAAALSPAARGQIEAEYRRAISRWDSDPWLRYGFAAFLTSQGDHRGAADQLSRVIHYLPHYYRAYEKLATALIQQRRFEEALVECRKALEVNPDFYTARYTMAFAYKQLGRLEEAIGVYQELLVMDSSPKLEIFNELGRLQVRRGEFENAASTFQDGISRNEDSEDTQLPDLYFNLSHALKKLGRTDEASQAREKAAAGYTRELERNPDLAGTYFALGSVFVEMRDFERAAERFRQAVRLNPADAASHMNLVKSLEAQGLLDEAIGALTQVLTTMAKLERPKEVRSFEAYRESLERKRRRLP
jgi:tetratricopeptide (TPR) repeat protein